MTASAFPKSALSHIGPINSGADLENDLPNDLRGTYSALPSLPHVSHELERYFQIARQIEISLSQQKKLNKRYEGELRDLERKFSQLASEAETKIQGSSVREDQLRSQLNQQSLNFQKLEKNFQKQMNDLSTQQKLEVNRYETELRELQTQHSHLALETSRRTQEAGLREERLRSQLGNLTQSYQQAEKLLHNQINDLSKSLSAEREQRQKSELDLQLLEANWEYMKQHKESLAAQLKKTQSANHFQMDSFTKITTENSKMKSELSSIQGSWVQMKEAEQKAKATFIVSSKEISDLKSKLEETETSLEYEKKKNHNMEELVRREREEKHKAFTQIHMLEAKLTQVNGEIENLKKQSLQNLPNAPFELKL